MKGLLKTTKGKAIFGASAAGVVGAVIAVSILLSSNGYRTIAVEEVNGTSIVQNEKNESNNAYQGMHLYSGDDVNVQTASDMTLLLDMDKYVYAEENTHFWLQAEGDGKTSKTRIYLDKGAELNRLDTKLKEGEEYEVDTPNSVMAVRGTVFRVYVYYDSDGIAWTIVEVLEGNVEISLKTLTGEFNGVTEVFGAGESAWIRASSDFSEFVADEEGNIKREIDYKQIPQGTALKLVETIDAGRELCIGKELLMDYTQLQEHKMEEVIVEEATCAKEGKKEIRCTVCNEVEETITLPKLSHEVPKEWEVVQEPDCVNKGLEQKVCSVCKEVVETREIDALGHTPGQYVVTRQATCTQEGRRVQRCTVCEEIIRTQTIAALPHVTGDWLITRAATCTAGSEMQKQCSVCGAMVETSSGGALGHNFGSWGQSSAATCTSGGSTSRTCSRCGYTESQSTDALGHSYGEWVELIPEYYCTTPGSRTRTCTRCGSQETQTIAASGHKLDGVEHIPVIDNNSGNMIQVQETGECTTCGKVIYETYSVTQVDGVYFCSHCGANIPY